MEHRDFLSALEASTGKLQFALLPGRPSAATRKAALALGSEEDPLAIRAVALIAVEGRTTDRVIRQLRGFPEITALHTTNGGWDLVAELRTESLVDFDQVLGRIRGVDGVVNSETSLLLSSVLR